MNINFKGYQSACIWESTHFCDSGKLYLLGKACNVMQFNVMLYVK